jgi:hypothetical protein
MKVKYIGVSDSHKIRASDWSGISEELGGPIEDEAVTFDSSNGFVGEVSGEAGAWLLEHMPNDFKEATEDDASAKPTAAKPRTAKS